METMHKNRHLTTAEAAAWLGVRPATLRQWRGRRSDSPPYIRLGTTRQAKCLYPLAGLQAFVESRTHRNTSEEHLSEKSNSMNDTQNKAKE